MFLPTSTYRVQLHKDFTFADLRGILDYLQELGINTIYAAPILQATPASTHGYDVTDPHHINPEIGTIEELIELTEDLKQRGIYWIQDIVPNHMAFSVHNPRLMDVLERGPLSPYYDYFDIDWTHPDMRLHGKLMVPFLGKELDQCLAEKEISLKSTPHGIVLSYFETNYPVSLPVYEFLLGKLANAARESIASLCNDAGKRLPLNEWDRIRKNFFLQLPPAQKEEIDRVLGALNTDAGELSKICELQYYALFFWKHTEHLINYRRFFTVNSLICLRMETEAVFNEYHQLIHQLYLKGLIQGVRIDHIDGLNDPSAYLKRLRTLLGKDCYIIAEKILEAKEEMPSHWPLEGTSGYEFLSFVNQLFTNRSGTGQLVEFYHTMLPGMPSYEEVVSQNKKLILKDHMAGELENLVTFFFDLNLQGSYSREGIRTALSLFMLSFPVYRIYPNSLPLTDSDRILIEETFEKAMALNGPVTRELGYLRSLFLAVDAGSVPGEKILRFMRRVMQFTGPLTAKGVEDTTFYIYNPLISHVEVGDSPSTLGITIQEFHQRMIRRQQLSPFSLNATATHDTKRGEDSRLRLNVISEIPQEWIGKVEEWMAINERFKIQSGDIEYPIVNDEYFIYQSILGGFPEDGEVSPEWISRLKEYIIKVVREAKIMTDWSDPFEKYEAACSDFIDKILSKDGEFLRSMRSFRESMLVLADRYSVAQAVVKITAPGIPDIYQGCE